MSGLDVGMSRSIPSPSWSVQSTVATTAAIAKFKPLVLGQIQTAATPREKMTDRCLVKEAKKIQLYTPEQSTSYYA
jgi:hypothetical protein